MERAYNGSGGGNILYGYALSTEEEREGACGVRRGVAKTRE